MYLIMVYIVILVLGLDSILKIILINFDKKVGSKVRFNGLRVKKLLNNIVVIVVNLVRDNLVF